MPASDAAGETSWDEAAALLGDFFNHRHDKLLCTANRQGEPSAALMGTPRLTADGRIAFEISDPASVTLDNIRENKAVLFVAYSPGRRARDYRGVRIYARVDAITTAGEALERIRTGIRKKHGAEKAASLQASVSCEVMRVRPIVDRGQPWNEPPFADD